MKTKGLITVGILGILVTLGYLENKNNQRKPESEGQPQGFVTQTPVPAPTSGMVSNFSTSEWTLVSRNFDPTKNIHHRFLTDVPKLEFLILVDDVYVFTNIASSIPLEQRRSTTETNAPRITCGELKVKLLPNQEFGFFKIQWWIEEKKR